MVKGLRIGRVFGIEITIDPSWLVIAFLFTWSFYVQFGLRFEDLAQAPILITAIGTALLFFGSVLLHELSHSVMAMRLGVPVEGITLFLFGGVSKMKMEANRPRDEFLIAVVGPLTSIALAGVFWLVVTLTSGLLSPLVLFALGYLGWLNLLLGIFNLLPGFPLDGGRVLRSILWRSSGSLVTATRGAARGGRIIASILIALGLVSVFTGNLGGLWMAAIGWFLLQAAGAADQDVVVRSFLEEVTAGDLMSPELVSIPFDSTIEEAVDDYFLRYDHSAFPVVSEERSGLLTLRAVRQIPKDQWGVRQAWSAMTDLRDACTVEPATPMNRVMEKIREMEQDRVLVVEDGRILGIITPRDVARWVQRSQELGLSPPEDVAPKTW
jgi:Zn-dependent protease/predicted transcriptional regulator